jgi:hypothetical protein
MLSWDGNVILNHGQICRSKTEIGLSRVVSFGIGTELPFGGGKEVDWEKSFHQTTDDPLVAASYIITCDN